ncbi:hypothetical protein [Bdellovibrio bacteriovorus]|uniref:hypothetical protein n=1 Tax=Bdellovibrio bacteriovorus TaxID=959 RepID=UPI003CFE2B4D
MKKLNIQHVTSILSMAFLLSACDRMAVDDSKVSLRLPKTVSGKAGAQSVSQLKHIAVQVTAADMTTPVVLILDSHDSQTVPSEITLEIPSGDNRLIQVLAAYGSGSNDDNAMIYYGDVTKNLLGGTDTADVPLDNLSGALPEEEGRVYGRYLTGVNQGPSGELKMVYRPAGKPGIVVDRQQILGGWFEATVFKNVPVDYVLPDGSLLGQQWTLDSLPLSKHLMRIRLPAHSEKRWEGNSNYWQDRGADNKFLGFFASQATLLDDKKVCAPAKTAKNSGDLYFGNKYLGHSTLNVIPIKAFFTGTTPQVSANFASIMGGLDISACSTLPLAEEFKRYLVLDNSNLGNELWESIEGLSGLRGGIAAPRIKSIDGITSYRNSYQYGGNANGSFLEVPLLPGIKDSVTSYQIYKATTGSMAPMGYDNRCEPKDLQRHGWILQRTNILPEGPGDSVQFTLGNIGFTPDQNSSYMLCLSKNNIPFGSQISFSSWTFAGQPAAALNLTMSSSPYGYASYPLVNECRRLEVNLSNTSGPVMNLNGVSVSLSAGGEAVLYADATCSTTASTNLNVTLPAGTTSLPVYVKSASPSSYQITIDSNSGGLTPPAALPMTVIDAPTTVLQVELSTNNSDMYAGYPAELKIYRNGCFPMKLRLTNSGISVVSSGSASLSWYKLDGTTSATPPTGTRLINNCVSRSAIGSLNFSATSIAEFAIEVGADLPTNLILKADGFSASAQIVFNNAPLVHHLSLRWPSGSSETPAVGSCQALEVVAKDAADQDLPIPAGQRLSFMPSTVYQGTTPGPLAEFFDGSDCSYNSNNYTISSGEVSRTIYVKAINAYAGYISYNSEHTERTQGYSTDLISKLALSPYVLPLSVTVPDPTILVGGFATFSIVGGVPPYTAQVLTGPGSVSVVGYPPHAIQVTASGVGTIQVSVTDSKGTVHLVNLTGQ